MRVWKRERSDVYPVNLEDTIRKQFVTLEIVFPSWRQSKVRKFLGDLPQSQKICPKQSPTNYYFSCGKLVFFFFFFPSSPCLIISARTTRNFDWCCVSDTEKPRMIVTGLTQLPVPPNAHCFFMRLLGFFCCCWKGLDFFFFFEVWKYSF